MANTKEMKEAADRFLEKLRNDPAKLKKFLRDIHGPERRKIEGQEREHLMTVFALIQPTSNSNNQNLWTDVYLHAGKEYHHTTGEDFDELAEILPDDIQQD